MRRLLIRSRDIGLRCAIFVEWRPPLGSELRAVDDLSALLEKALELFARDQFYTDAKLPGETDLAVIELVESFAKAAPAERTQLIAEVPNKYASHFVSFGVRMAILGVRENSSARVLQGLIALAIENCRVDWREDLMTMAPLDDAATRVGADPVALFDQAASYATPETAEKMKAFVRRHPELKSIKVMGFSAVETPQGFSYEFHWP